MLRLSHMVYRTVIEENRWKLVVRGDSGLLYCNEERRWWGSMAKRIPLTVCPLEVLLAFSVLIKNGLDAP